MRLERPHYDLQRILEQHVVVIERDDEISPCIFETTAHAADDAEVRFRTDHIDS